MEEVGIDDGGNKLGCRTRPAYSGVSRRHGSTERIRRTHTPRAVMEAALAQTIRSKVEAAYARRIRRPSRSTRSLTTVAPPRPGLRTATRRPSAAGSSGSAQT